MKTFVTAIAVCFLVAGLSARQDPASPQTPQKPAVAEVTLTGCLVQGSTPAVFIFENARKDPKSTTEPALKYIVVTSTEDLNLRNHLNHQVRISGLPDGKVAPPTTQKVEEKDLPKLSAKTVTMVADTCSSPSR
jgi:hypothetical protein